MNFTSRAFLFGVIALGAGCGGTTPPETVPHVPAAKIVGKVTLDNIPLTVGEVLFQSEDGKSVMGAIDKDGEYSVNDAPVGKSKIALIFTGFADNADVHFDPEGKQVMMPKGKKIADGSPDLPELEKTVPMAYKHVDTSGLTLVTVAGENRFDIRLTKAP